MTVETVNGISDLDDTYPDGGDSKSEGDNHIRNIKTALTTDLPNITGPVTATQDELNILDGATLTTDELNKLDESAQAVTNFTYSNINHIDSNGQYAGDFDVNAVIGAGWESVGPTGSGATNIWTALDSLPANTKWIELLIHTFAGDTSGNVADMELFIRQTGTAAAAVFRPRRPPDRAESPPAARHLRSFRQGARRRPP